MPDRPPAKPWRVYGPRTLSTDHRSQRAAYEAVKSVTSAGYTARVWHWEHGGWVRYEIIEPITAGEGEQ